GRCAQRPASPNAYTRLVYRKAEPTLSRGRCSGRVPLMRLGALVIPAFLAASLLGAAGSAWANEGSQTSAVKAAFAPGAPPLVWPLLVLVVTAAPALRRRRSLRLAAAALVLVLLGFAFQSALHSAHHGPDHAASAACATASLASASFPRRSSWTIRSWPTSSRSRRSSTASCRGRATRFRARKRT